MDQHFKLAGASECALDAVAHGGDFAANGLSDGDDVFLGRHLGLGELDGDFGERTGGEPQILGAPDHGGDGKEQHDRRNDATDEREAVGRANRATGWASTEKSPNATRAT